MTIKPVVFLLGLALLAGCQPVSQEFGGAAEGGNLTGQEWVLRAYGPAGNETAALAQPAVTAIFEDGTLRGLGGCNSYGTTYEIDGQALTLGPIEATMMACLEPGIMEQEAAFLAALATAASYEVMAEALTIVYDGGVLRFTPAPPPSAAALEGTTWQLEVLEKQEGDVVVGQPVPEGMLVTINFQEGQLSGSSGCNNFGAPYQVTGGQLAIGPLTRTEAICPTEAQILAEGQLIGGLEMAKSFAIARDQLTISYPGGKLIFRAWTEAGQDTSPVSTEMVEPPAATLAVAGQVQSAGIGSYCWSLPRGEETVQTCADKSGIATPPEPLAAGSSPVAARLTLPLSQTPTRLALITFPVTEAEAQASEAAGNRWWDVADIEPTLLPLKPEQDLVFELPPGLHVVQISAWWDGVGDVVFGFLLEVTPPSS